MLRNAARYSMRCTRPLPCLDSLVCPFHFPLCLSLLIEPNVAEYLVDLALQLFQVLP